MWYPVSLCCGSLAVVVGFCAVPASAAAASPSPSTQPAKELKVAAVQMRPTDNLEENIKKTIDFIGRCAQDAVRVVVFPECSMVGSREDTVLRTTAEQLAAAEERVAQACRQHHTYAIVGMPTRDKDKLFNSAVIFSPEGRVIDRYHKMQLAERWSHPGDHLSVYKIDGVMCTTIICHDERYPELVRLPVLVGAQVVFYISSESGLRHEHKIGPYRAQIQARAVENEVWVVHANCPANEDGSGSHGQSRIIAPDGNIVQEASIFREEVIAATINLGRATRMNAKKSLRCDLLREWWEEGMKLVRVIE